MKNKKILIIVLIIILVLAIAGSVFGYLFIATDTFKSSKELFSIYMTQNINILEELQNSTTKKIYEDLDNEQQYETTTKLNLSYSEGGEISNPINNLALQLDTQRDDTSEYFYADGQILYDDEEYLESEIAKDGKYYGVRFSDITRQFVTITKDDQLEKIANKIGIKSIRLENMMEIIDGTFDVVEETLPKEDVVVLKEKYVKIIQDAIKEGKFSSLKKSMITYNNNVINTDSYSVVLDSEQVENLTVEFLTNLKNESLILDKISESQDLQDYSNVDEQNFNETIYTEFIDQLIEDLTLEKMPELKITIYEQNKVAIRTTIELGTNKIIIEPTNSNGNISIKMQINETISDVTREQDIQITKNNSDNKENYEIIIKNTSGEEESTIKFASEMEMNNNQIRLGAQVSYSKNIVEVAIKLFNTVNITGNFEKKLELNDNTNNIILNYVNDETLDMVISSLKENVPKKAEIRLNLLAKELGIKPVEEKPTEMSEVEINQFNAKFEFYTGNSVSASNVEMLLSVVKDHLKDAEITQVYPEGLEPYQVRDDQIKYNFKLNIEKDTVNEEKVNEILDILGENNRKKYNVTITYSDLNGLIDYIMVEEID